MQVTCADPVMPGAASGELGADGDVCDPDHCLVTDDPAQGVRAQEFCHQWIKHPFVAH